MARMLFLIIGFLLSTNITFGCSMIVGLPVPDNPIWINGKLLRQPPGEVVEIIKVSKPKSEDYRSDAEALKIKVTEYVYSTKQTTYFEVLPLRIYPDCSLQGETGLNQDFPVGSKVRVIAEEASIYKKDSDNSITRLETSMMNQGSITRNDLDESLKTSAESFYDYSRFAVKKPTTLEEEILFYSRLELLKFELQKDLARLLEAKTEDERLKVMERLVYYPHIYAVPYHTLAQAYLMNSEKRKSLESKWEERKQEQIRLNKQTASQ
jgi:hypothetical protein